MKVLSVLLASVASAAVLTSDPAFAMETRSGPGMMRCSVVLSRLSSPDAADRMAVLSWAQGYLSGIASVASAFDGTSDVQVPTYDELQPRILARCQADPASDLYHATRYLSSRRDAR